MLIQTTWQPGCDGVRNARTAEVRSRAVGRRGDGLDDDGGESRAGCRGDARASCAKETEPIGPDLAHVASWGTTERCARNVHADDEMELGNRVKASGCTSRCKVFKRETGSETRRRWMHGIDASAAEKKRRRSDTQRPYECAYSMGLTFAVRWGKAMRDGRPPQTETELNKV